MATQISKHTLPVPPPSWRTWKWHDIIAPGTRIITYSCACVQFKATNDGVKARIPLSTSKLLVRMARGVVSTSAVHGSCTGVGRLVSAGRERSGMFWRRTQADLSSNLACWSLSSIFKPASLLLRLMPAKEPIWDQGDLEGLPRGKFFIYLWLLFEYRQHSMQLVPPWCSCML